MVDLNTIDSPEQLKAELDGKNTDAIMEMVNELGIDAVLARVFATMASRFDAAKAAGQNCTVGWNVTAGDQTYSYVVRVADGSCSADEGPTTSTDITLTLTIADFLRLVSGMVNGTAAFMGGQLKLTGNPMTALAMQTWFGM